VTRTWVEGPARPAPTPPPQRLWPRRSGWALVAAHGVGLALLVVAAIGPTRADALGRQVTWLDVGGIGVALVSAAQAGWLIAGRRAVGRYRRWLLPDGHVEIVAGDAGADRR
jgi:hypothetical protein